MGLINDHSSVSESLDVELLVRGGLLQSESLPSSRHQHDNWEQTNRPVGKTSIWIFFHEQVGTRFREGQR